MAPGGSPHGSGGSSGEEDAKEVLDKIGQQVYAQMKTEDTNYIGELKGSLTSATLSVGETASSLNPCTFEYNKLAGSDASGKSQPCRKDVKGEDINRFSDTQGAECANSKIEGNKNNSEGGACAPYRRLHVCDKNMVKMDTIKNDSKAKNDLLAEVCLAAKYEGETLTRYHPQYQTKYNDSQICTVLARSFADIGDIVRGKDLYLGNKKKSENKREKEKLEENFKKYFQQIHEKLTTKNGVKDHYNDPKGDFFQLREDWWTVNRDQVWKALTCDDKLSNYKYFRATCDSSDKKGQYQAHDKCRCPNETDQVPTYFDYWGSDFCGKRARMLEKIKGDCEVEESSGGSRRRDGKKCSGFGEDCQTNLKNDPSTIPSLECPRCATSCRSYKKWIEKKKEEFTKQSNVYEEQKQNCKKESKGGVNGVCETLQENAAQFLERLKNGPCKNDSGQDKTGNSHIKFDDQNKDKTFGHETYCDPCSAFTVKCENGNCSDDNVKKCQNKKITAQKIENGENPIKEVVMRVSDDSTNGVEGDLKDCENEGIFEGIRKDEWICGTVCGYNVCKPAKVNGQKDGEKHIITIRALVTHWVHNFLEDYNKIKHKISHCMEKGEPSNCINGCNKKCNCVDKWIDQKKGEWPKIRERYFKQYSDKNMDGVYKVRAILEDLQDRPEFKEAIKPCDGLENFEKSCGLNVTERSEKGKKDENNDHVLCMIRKLKDKIDKCKAQHTGEKQANCENSPSTTPNDEEEEYENEDENEKKVESPTICPKETVDQKTKVEDEKCDKTPPVVPEVQEEKEEEKDKGDEKEEKRPQPPPPPPPAPRPRPGPQPPPPSQLLDNPQVLTALVTSTIMWSIGIGFAAFTYFYLK
ncbi:hypothetical protein PFMALIP_05684, partial [Plasmodium falciparum MaliPS096_E11]